VAQVRLRGQLRALAGGEAQHRIDAGGVAAALAELERDQPALRGWILDERGAIRRHINVFVNGEYADRDTPLSAEDRVEVIPAISGGHP
jgi:molybdopterin converting factor small subunit